MNFDKTDCIQANKDEISDNGHKVTKLTSSTTKNDKSEILYPKNDNELSHEVTKPTHLLTSLFIDNTPLTVADTQLEHEYATDVSDYINKTTRKPIFVKNFSESGVFQTTVKNSKETHLIENKYQRITTQTSENTEKQDLNKYLHCQETLCESDKIALYKKPMDALNNMLFEQSKSDSSEEGNQKPLKGNYITNDKLVHEGKDNSNYTNKDHLQKNSVVRTIIPEDKYGELDVSCEYKQKDFMRKRMLLLIGIILYCSLVVVLFMTRNKFLFIPIFIIPAIPIDIEFYKKLIQKTVPFYKTKKHNIMKYDHKGQYVNQVRKGTAVNIMLAMIYFIFIFFSSTARQDCNSAEQGGDTRFNDFEDTKMKESLINFFPPGEKLDDTVCENLKSLAARTKDDFYPQVYSADYNKNIFDRNLNVNPKEEIVKAFVNHEETNKSYQRKPTSSSIINALANTPDYLLTHTLGRTVDPSYSPNPALLAEYEKFHANYVSLDGVDRYSESNIPFKNIHTFVFNKRNLLAPMQDLKIQEIDSVFFKELKKNRKIIIVIWPYGGGKLEEGVIHLMRNMIQTNICVKVKNYEMITCPEKYREEIWETKKAIRQHIKVDKSDSLFYDGIAYEFSLKENMCFGDVFIDVGRFCVLGHLGLTWVSPFFGNEHTKEFLAQGGIKRPEQNQENLAIHARWIKKLRTIKHDPSSDYNKRLKSCKN
ncbi:hypothetical protein CDIK_0360 [Cucumispora dikerogammari]|nr:hypothetical protein CDIK_0360 [Cucumispora dikerogammari]